MWGRMGLEKAEEENLRDGGGRWRAPTNYLSESSEASQNISFCQLLK
jgi:hypothetical protein